jgi:hypothetical protein
MHDQMVFSCKTNPISLRSLIIVVMLMDFLKLSARTLYELSSVCACMCVHRKTTATSTTTAAASSTCKEEREKILKNFFSFHLTVCHSATLMITKSGKLLLGPGPKTMS